MTERRKAQRRVAEAADRWVDHPRQPERYGELVAAVEAWRRLRDEDRPPVEPFVDEAAGRPEPSLGAPMPDRSTQPRMHRHAEFLRAKQGQWGAPHVAPIQALVDEIREVRQTDTVPYVDPVSGGVLARVLFVLESPARPAALGSGMLSPDNNDQTAANMWQLYRQSGLTRSAALHWNAVPWYVGENGKGRRRPRATWSRECGGCTDSSICCRSSDASCPWARSPGRASSCTPRVTGNGSPPGCGSPTRVLSSRRDTPISGRRSTLLSRGRPEPRGTTPRPGDAGHSGSSAPPARPTRRR